MFNWAVKSVFRSLFHLKKIFGNRNFKNGVDSLCYEKRNFNLSYDFNSDAGDGGAKQST
jgi:hypothetical protein